MNWLDLLQWPAMVVTVTASWLVASSKAGHRNVGFWVFLLSNVLWVAWALHASAYALIVLQLCLAAMNIRGARKSGADSEREDSDKRNDNADRRSAADGPA